MAVACFNIKIVYDFLFNYFKLKLLYFDELLCMTKISNVCVSVFVFVYVFAQLVWHFGLQCMHVLNFALLCSTCE